jgi:cell division protein FtsW (lipid II flippase)
MLGFAVFLTLVAQCIVDLTVTNSLRPELFTFGLWISALWLVAHLVVRRWAAYADPLLLPAVALLVGLGLAVIHRLDLAGEQSGSSAGRADAPVQLVWATLGTVLFVGFLAFVRDHRSLSRYAYTLALIGMGLLALPALLPASLSEVNGAKIWIRLAGFSIQPGEFAKIFLIVFFAAYLVDKRDVLALASRKVAGLELPRGRDLGPVLVAWLLSILVLVFERDLGSSLLLFGVFVVMLYVATERTSWILFGLLMAGLGFWAVAATEAHVQSRITDWLHPLTAAPNGGGVGQIGQALFALGAGGVLGTGLGQGHSWLIGFAAKSDFILGTIGEELGLAGLMALFLLYALLFERGLRTALAARDPFGKLLAVGLSGAFALQVFIVAGGVTGTIPLTGMTLPFMAQGGSSVITNWALIAILLKISDVARRPAPAPETAAEPTQVLGPS